MEVSTCGFFPCQAGSSWKVEAEHCVWPWISHSIKHNDRWQETWVSILDLPFMSCVYCIFCERIFSPSKGPTPNLTAENLEMVAGFCTQFIYRLHLQEEALG